MTFTQLVLRVGALSDIIDAYHWREGEKAHPHWPWVYPGEPEVPPPPEEAELEALLESLPEETLYGVAMAKWAGLHRSEVDDLPRFSTEVKARFGKLDATVWALVNQPGLTDEYTEGLSRLAKAGFDIGSEIGTAAVA